MFYFILITAYLANNLAYAASVFYESLYSRYDFQALFKLADEELFEYKIKPHDTPFTSIEISLQHFSLYV